MFEFFVFVYGAIIGSFLNVVIYRIPHNISLINPKRSHCINCKQSIKWYENIPLVSFILLGAKCSNCQTKISITYFVVELLSGIITLLLYLKFGFGFEFFLYIVLFYILIVLSIIDLHHKSVPDYFLLGALIISFLIPSFDFLYCLVFAGGFVLLNFFVTFYIQNIKSKLTKNEALKQQQALGDGDIPIIALIGGILGLKLALVAIFLSALFALFPALYGTIAKKEIETPFIPYLVLGLGIVFFFEASVEKILLWFSL